MKFLDNKGGSKKVNVPTFYLKVKDIDFSYTYIRKNACTSFKHLFKAFSNHDFHKSGSDLKGMADFHLLKNKMEVERIGNRLFVYRDPVDRVVSVYKNKFIQRSGAEDIMKDFYKHTGVNPDDCSFEFFLKKYVCLIKKGVMIDAHLLPQVWHLYPLEYKAIHLPDIEKDMSLILGNDVGSKYFSKPVNSSSSIRSYDDKDAFKFSSAELHYDFKEKSIMPSFKGDVKATTKEILSEIYSDDYSMIDRMI